MNPVLMSIGLGLSLPNSFIAGFLALRGEPYTLHAVLLIIGIAIIVWQLRELGK